MAATKLTVREIQEKLGYKIEIIDEPEKLLSDIPVGDVAKLSNKSDEFDVVVLVPRSLAYWTATAKSVKAYFNAQSRPYACTANGSVNNNGCWHEYWYRPFFVLKNDTTVY